MQRQLSSTQLRKWKKHNKSWRFTQVHRSFLSEVQLRIQLIYPDSLLTVLILHLYTFKKCQVLLFLYLPYYLNMHFIDNIFLLASILQAQNQPWLRGQGEDRNGVGLDALIIYTKLFLLGIWESTANLTLYIAQLSLQKISCWPLSFSNNILTKVPVNN